ncbi:DUF3021 domain-containing protein [Metabacillus iocasae]|uniref:Membrane protein n=1 Tax=Priestia iocasae TaxID=2291674 RepID=A0ABS2QSM0_9BACI|nr:DUF3021 domain-containing protein [Metabacillus iocasae]MBM7702461.1 putative membrane protein [Metabacillus iocasae]
MIVKLLTRSFAGLGFGAIMMLIFLFIFYVQGIEEINLSLLLVNMIGSLFIGMYWGVSSCIFENGRWSPLKQLVIHFILSVLVYYPIAISLGWLPLGVIEIFISFFIFLFIYMTIWFGMRVYFKKLEDSLNKLL